MDSSSYSPRRRSLRDDLMVGAAGGDDLKEGEYVPGRDDSSDTDDEDGGAAYRFQHVAPPRSRSRSPSPCESDGTISDDDLSAGGLSEVTAGGATAARRFACHVCGRAFRSPKAVDGHMRVHGNVRQVAAAAVVAGGWAATGKRGWTGGKPSVVAVVSRNNPESTEDHSTAIVAVRPLEPMPTARIAAMPNLSATHHELSMRNNLSGEESSNTSVEPMRYEHEVITRPNPSSPVAAVVHQQAAAPSAADHQQAHPVHHLPAVPPPPPATRHPQFVQQQPLVAPPAQQPPRREYSCKLCGKSYATHQGLGGHAAGHRNRQKEAEAAAAAAAAGMMMDGSDADAFLAAFRRGGRKAEEPHECQKCHKVFATGVALGGHMRMHYTGPPIVHKKSKKRCLAPPPPLMSGADLSLALSTTIKEEPSPAAPAAAAGRVRLFGIDIVPQVQAPSEEQGSGTAEMGSSSTAGEQQ